ncbi:MAG: S-methyl-5-thioribose-1-phosphate isomerase [Cenarchaeum sp. SB0661_bin_35]|nr:S-methyl-5-thioribose-1-phosphate isomerase [Cenarchaeum sp. SB0667_bin_13]MXY37393.1 S-methyl-5-thioribose-1-phosphate isomerase [Cenarchaeum sp. SB0664_bin_35]MXZ92965.1 S-methyl-5-thioribose-1-phosphate isomerase [Cenarchaeum sp. SB0666_bin_15]MYC79047.1 S-methyl-5-thioribose-1-phosphate isomerase [Cenarchaeum sp. SB0661_bin_35]MYD58811.1 S-methyl-5-thioribose-1-phosphate isomerase [Cenarchaeum sp. SB0678_bin_8]MYI52107.1 S-methyl-5-thioribose-1-phosphate isomerase [Cenarchaeum sp. SB067
MLRTILWRDDKVAMIDQTKLPGTLEYVEYDDYKGVADAIRNLVIRGAPAIGVAAAFGMVLAARQSQAETLEDLLHDLNVARMHLGETRPTAVNLVWALNKIYDTARLSADPNTARTAVFDQALSMAEDDITTNKTMGRNGSQLFNDGDTIMTHCNAGALATVGYGTALGVIRATKDSGKSVQVVATETRPVQQGSRLTAFELMHDNIDVSLIPDTAVGYAMANRLIDKVVVGADRILSTGHVYNKIGTYQVATMARQHGIPFYVAAPLSTFDMESEPKDVVIEMRRSMEVSGPPGNRTAPEGINVLNPAFDMTPPELVSGIITEAGVATTPYVESIKKLFKANF